MTCMLPKYSFMLVLVKNFVLVKEYLTSLFNY